VLVLLRRKADSNPLLPTLADMVRANFAELQRRMAGVLGA
jgi:hypothetical protein